MSPEFFLHSALVPALKLLPASMGSKEACAMIVTICLQESRLKYRRQINGPARGYAQFEQGGGVRGVLTHQASKPHIKAVLYALDYDQDLDAEGCWIAIEHNDILAAAFARLLLYTLPQALPARNAPGMAWSQYLQGWRPGRPHRGTFDAFFEQAWKIV